ncbi:MAG: DUF2461 domain-containing protein [Dokdonella sp.]|uniref:DUF2461 domain-containing protein n=1 Tax=Dokdonella sp. TaxID=2291710 RepID=UPI0025BEE08C|nr:DUF2461 domain-containing protein [Dokdonella sp.]MBX3700063.1 DUF2461 domain-containing protein [Dokdonella sp.]MCW5577075.1 DUF2461 domain-containing protein [Dokdonella sp.]
MSNIYFSRATFRFLRELAANNNRSWFHANKARYEAVLREPYLQLIADLAAPLAKLSPHYRADPRKQGGSLFRLQRDTRFRHDKTPYKTWAGARLGHERRHEVQAPSFYMEIEPGHCFAGGGIWRPEPATLRRIRDFLVDNPAAWRRAVHGRSFTEHFTFWGESLQRSPRGFDPAHELAGDIRRKAFAAGAHFSDALACSDELRPHLIATFKRIAPMVDYLCAALDLEF